MADLLATSPIVNPGQGYQARRIVLSVIRNEDGSPREFVVQRQCFDENGRATMAYGNWMPIFDDDPAEVQKTAWAIFKERADHELHAFPLADLRLERFVQHVSSLTIDTGKG